MKKGIIICFLLLSILSYGQDYKLPIMKHYETETYTHWNDSNTLEQVVYYNNDNIRIEYVKLNDTHRLRKEYWDNGRIKAEMVVYQIFRTDKDTTFDRDDPNIILAIDIESGLVDIPDGAYTEYYKPFNSKKDIQLTRGQFKNGYQADKWETQLGPFDETITATYNDFGVLNGEYIEYYSTYPKPKQKIKFIGNYSAIEFKFNLWSGYKRDGKPIVLARRVEKWRFYSKEGELIETIKYPKKTHYAKK